MRAQGRFQTRQCCWRVVGGVGAVIDTQEGTQCTEQCEGISSMLEGDKAGTRVQTGARQPVCSFAYQSGLTDPTKARDDDQLVSQQVTFELQQFASTSTEAVARFGGHLAVQAGQRRARRLGGLASACWPGGLQSQGSLLVVVREPPVTQFDGLTLL